MVRFKTRLPLLRSAFNLLEIVGTEVVVPTSSSRFVLVHEGAQVDRVAEKKLNKSLPIATTHQAADYLERNGFQRTEPFHAWEEEKYWISLSPWTRAKHHGFIISATAPPTRWKYLPSRWQ